MSKFNWVFILILVSGVSFWGSPASAATERVTKPTAVSLELFGRSMLYTVQVDSMLADQLGAGIGFGTVGLRTPGGNDINQNARLLPVYMNYYFQDEQGSVFATVGASLLMNKNDAAGRESTIGNVIFSTSGVQPSFGVGYENRSPTGILMRITAYGIVGKELYPWFGFALGYAF